MTARSTRGRCKCGFEYVGPHALLRKCPRCAAKRKPKYVAEHNKVLKESVDVFVEANDGYHGCWVCRHLGIELKGPLQRDHVHEGEGIARGILCIYHNRKLGPAYKQDLLEALLAYVSRGERSAVDELKDAA